MIRFFKSLTSDKLYSYLKSRVPGGDQSIRQSETLDRLHATGKMLSEQKAQSYKRDVAESVFGFDVEFELEKDFAKSGVVIAPLSDNFKKELQEKAESHRLRVETKEQKHKMG